MRRAGLSDKAATEGRRRAPTSRGGDGPIRTKGQRDPMASRNGGELLRAHAPSCPAPAATATPRRSATATAAPAKRIIIGTLPFSLLSSIFSLSKIPARVGARFSKNENPRGYFGDAMGAVGSFRHVLPRYGWLGHRPLRADGIGGPRTSASSRSQGRLITRYYEFIYSTYSLDIVLTYNLVRLYNLNVY
jgi:hypothetical protein